MLCVGSETRLTSIPIGLRNGECRIAVVSPSRKIRRMKATHLPDRVLPADTAIKADPMVVFRPSHKSKGAKSCAANSQRG